MKLLAMDPGEKIGWARCDVDAKGKATGLVTGITPLKDMALRIAKVYETYDIVIVETWRMSATHSKNFIGSSFPTVQFIGMVRLLSWLHPDTKIVWQDPRVKTTAIKTAAKLKPTWHEIMTAPGAHDVTHDADAVMHLWMYIWSTFVGSKEVQ